MMNNTGNGGYAMETAMDRKKPVSVWNRNFTLLFIVNFVVNFGHSMVANLLPK